MSKKRRRRLIYVRPRAEWTKHQAFGDVLICNPGLDDLPFSRFRATHTPQWWRWELVS